jgi:hypothetical protein
MYKGKVFNRAKAVVKRKKNYYFYLIDSWEIQEEKSWKFAEKNYKIFCAEVKVLKQNHLK